LGSVDDNAFAARYDIHCDASWHVNKVEIAEIGSDLTTQLTSDGIASWVDRSGAVMPQLGGAIDIDISITPFTNTLAIRRLNLRTGQSEKIIAVYIRVPGLSITTDRQRYTCLETGRRYRYESLDSDFTREIEIDVNGLVVIIPACFEECSSRLLKKAL